MPVGYNKDHIPLVEMVTMKISFKNRSTVERISMVKRGSNLLGRKHQRDLGIVRFHIS